MSMENGKLGPRSVSEEDRRAFPMAESMACSPSRDKLGQSSKPLVPHPTQLSRMVLSISLLMMTSKQRSD